MYGRLFIGIPCYFEYYVCHVTQKEKTTAVWGLKYTLVKIKATNVSEQKYYQ